MATLLFFDDEHKYTLDGEELPSVSELCRFISREVYGDVTQYTLDNAADRGTRVHKACEALDLYGRVEVSDDILPYLQAYIKFRKEHAAKWDKVEYAAHHATDRYAGTLDRVGTVDEKNCILDIKTSYIVQKRLAIAQLNLYRRMMEQDSKWTADALYILHLNKAGEYRLHEFDRNDEVPNALLTLHNLMKKKRRKKNV
jgi:hypothetical protein